MNAKIGFKLQVTATLEFQSLHNWCYQLMWLFSSAPDDPEDDTVIEKHCAEGLYSAVQSLMYALRTEDEEAQQNGAHPIIQSAKRWMIRRLSELKLANGKPCVPIAMENAHLIDFVWSNDEQAKPKTIVGGYTSRGTLGALWVLRRPLACCWLVLGDTENHNDLSGQWYDKWPHNTCVDSPIFWWLRERFLPMLVNQSNRGVFWTWHRRRIKTANSFRTRFKYKCTP